IRFLGGLGKAGDQMLGRSRSQLLRQLGNQLLIRIRHLRSQSPPTEFTESIGKCWIVKNALALVNCAPTVRADISPCALCQRSYDGRPQAREARQNVEVWEGIRGEERARYASHARSHRSRGQGPRNAHGRTAQTPLPLQLLQG